MGWEIWVKENETPINNKMTKETKKWWEIASEYYQKECKIPVDIHYGPGSPNESVLKLLGNLKGKKVLEIGCGGAQCGIAMAKQGAKVTGVDISEKQLKFAKKLAEKNKVRIKFIQRDIVNLKPIKSNSQDIVFSAYALIYVDDLNKCFKEVYRVLKKKGIFVFSLDHPFDSMIDKKTMKVKRSYFKTGRYSEKYTHGVWVGYNRTVGDLFNWLIKAGFQVERIIEPDSRKKNKGDYWYGLWDYKKKALSTMPPTMIFKARK